MYNCKYEGDLNMFKGENTKVLCSGDYALQITSKDSELF